MIDTPYDSTRHDTDGTPIKTDGMMRSPMAVIVILLLLCSTPLLAQMPPVQRPVIIERIEIEGATKTDKAVISRYLTITTGDTISLNRLSRVIESDGRRLTQTNFFKEIDYCANN